eukprot:8288333-Ditylum_brightwellii.AAC.1
MITTIKIGITTSANRTTLIRKHNSDFTPCKIHGNAHDNNKCKPQQGLINDECQNFCNPNGAPTTGTIAETTTIVTTQETIETAMYPVTTKGEVVTKIL